MITAVTFTKDIIFLSVGLSLLSVSLCSSLCFCALYMTVTFSPWILQMCRLQEQKHTRQHPPVVVCVCGGSTVMGPNARKVSFTLQPNPIYYSSQILNQIGFVECDSVLTSLWVAVVTRQAAGV